MHSEKVGAFRSNRTEKVGAFRANKTKKRLWGGVTAAHTHTALIWEYPPRVQNSHTYDNYNIHQY